MPDQDEPRREPGDGTGETGAEGGSEGSADTPPPVPDEDDESALGDTDQHSSSQA